MSLLDTASLIVTPNAVKESKLYSVIPSDGSGDMSVVRATTATRVNSAGLVELVPYNLLSWSEDLSQWTANTQIATTQLVANPLTGLNNATKITKVTSAGDPWIVQNVTAGDGTFTYSAYLWTDSGQPTDVTLFLYNASITEVYTLSITLTTTPTRYEFSPTFANSGGNLNARIDLSGSATNQYIYAYAAQLVEGSTAKPYQKTETRLNIPRLDYSNGSCPSLLVEPQRTNIALYSEDIAQSIPTFGGGSVTANNTIAPSGILNADKFTIDTSNSVHYFYKQYASVNGQSYTTSIFLKAGTGRYFLYRILTNGTAWRYGVTIDLETGTILSQNSMGTPTGTSSKIEDYGNGWYRVSLSINSFGTEIATLLETSNTGTPSLDANIDYFYTGNGTDSYYIWGNQLEAGSYATSYIPTTSASVTRNADVISKTGISSLIGQTEGTIFVDCKINALPIDGSLFGIQKTASNFVIRFGSQGNNIYAQCFNGSSNLFFEATSYTLGSRVKVAFAYKLGSYAFYINGVQIAIGSNATAIPACDETMFNSLWGNFNNSLSFYNSAALWKTRLTNTQLAQLTTI